MYTTHNKLWREKYIIRRVWVGFLCLFFCAWTWWLHQHVLLIEGVVSGDTQNCQFCYITKGCSYHWVWINQQWHKTLESLELAVPFLYFKKGTGYIFRVSDCCAMDTREIETPEISENLPLPGKWQKIITYSIDLPFRGKGGKI